MVIVLLVGLYTSRVVLNVLGVSDYGIYNVVAGFVSLFAFLNATLSSSMQRFYNYEGGNRGEQGYRDVFSMGMRVHVVLSVVVFFALETFGVWYINNIMVLPVDRLEAAHILFQLSVVSMLMVILQIPYGAAIIANEKMDYYAFVSIVDVVLKLIIVILLPYIQYDKLIVYGICLMSVQIMNFLMYLIYSKVHFKYLKLTKVINISHLKNLLFFSGWNLVGTVAFMLKGQGVNMLLNSFFGTIVNAARGVAFQINGAVMGFSQNISLAFKPQLVESYASGDARRVYNLFLVQSKICYGLTLMLIVPVIFEIDYLLHIWLGNAVPENTNIFSALVLVDLLVCTLNAPVTQIVFATGNIKYYQIISSIINLALLPVCWAFLKLGAEAWVAFLIVIVFSCINQCACIIAMHGVFKFSYIDYVKSIVLPCLLLSVLLPIIPYAITLVMEDSFYRLCVICIVSLFLTSFAIYFFFLSQGEKKSVNNYLTKLFRKNKD